MAGHKQQLALMFTPTSASATTLAVTPVDTWANVENMRCTKQGVIDWVDDATVNVETYLWAVGVTARAEWGQRAFFELNTSGDAYGPTSAYFSAAIENMSDVRPLPPPFPAGFRFGGLVRVAYLSVPRFRSVDFTTIDKGLFLRYQTRGLASLEWQGFMVRFTRT